LRYKLCALDTVTEKNALIGLSELVNKFHVIRYQERLNESDQGLRTCRLSLRENWLHGEGLSNFPVIAIFGDTTEGIMKVNLVVTELSVATYI